MNNHYLKFQDGTTQLVCSETGAVVAAWDRILTGEEVAEIDRDETMSFMLNLVN